MQTAARVGDMTTHNGMIAGPGASTVLIGGSPSALVNDNHICGLPPDTHPLTSSPFPAGSLTVFIEGKPALRSGDICLCGATAIPGQTTVLIG